MSLTVLHAIPSLVGGGAERQLVKLTAGLSATGVDVHLAYLHAGPNLDAASKSGATLHRLQCSGNHDPRVLLGLRTLIRMIRPAVVQTWLLHADVFGGLAARWCGVPWLLSERSSAAMYSKGFKFALRRRLGLRADTIVANSEGGLAYWRAAGYTGPGHVIRNMTEVPPTGLRDHGVANRLPTLIAVGRLSEEKNYPLLLDALDIAFKRLPAVRATILGEGPARSQIEARIASSATLEGRVDLPGHVSDVTDRLAHATVFVSLSRFEGTPNTVIEAMVNGCPLVVSDIPAHRELLSAEEARIVPLDSPDVIAEALFAQLTDAGTARRQAMRARDRVGDWSTERIADQYITVYHSLRQRSSACES